MRRGLLHSLLLIGALLFAAPQAYAQAAVNEAALAEARKMMAVIKAEAMVQQMASQMMGLMADALGKANPGKEAEIRAAVTDLILPEFSAAMPEMLDDMARLYTLHFTAEELRAVIAFYETPVGRKTIEKMPVLMQQAMIMGQAASQRIVQRIIEKNGDALRARGIKNL
jgi:hypothetical protein